MLNSHPCLLTLLLLLINGEILEIVLTSSHMLRKETESPHSLTTHQGPRSGRRQHWAGNTGAPGRRGQVPPLTPQPHVRVSQCTHCRRQECLRQWASQHVPGKHLLDRQQELRSLCVLGFPTMHIFLAEQIGYAVSQMCRK